MKQRNTKQRQLVLEAVRSRCDHPTADQIYLAVREKDAKISRGTVYRNLGILEENGELLRVEAPDASRYDLTIRRHYHVHCTCCGMVCDAPLDYQYEHDQAVAEATGFKIASHETVFEGICPACLVKQEPEERAS